MELRQLEFELFMIFAVIVGVIWLYCWLLKHHPTVFAWLLILPSIIGFTLVGAAVSWILAVLLSPFIFLPLWIYLFTSLVKWDWFKR